MQARCRRVFGNAHTYHINAISISSDQETFISSDDLRVNLWHLDHTNQSFNVVDIKPPNMEDLTEVPCCCVLLGSNPHSLPPSTFELQAGWNSACTLLNDSNQLLTTSGAVDAACSMLTARCATVKLACR